MGRSVRLLLCLLWIGKTVARLVRGWQMYL